MERKSINDELKAQEAEKNNGNESNESVKLDDTQRVKVLSPGRLVFKRFIRNKLAIVGSAILIFMFAFSFIGAMLYPYGQTQKFYKYDTLNITYASSTERTEYSLIEYNHDIKIDATVKNMMNSYIIEMQKKGVSSMTIEDNGSSYYLSKVNDNAYKLDVIVLEKVASVVNEIAIGTYTNIPGIGGSFAFKDGIEPFDDGFVDMLNTLDEAGMKKGDTFEFNGGKYIVTSTGKLDASISKLTDGTVLYEKQDAGYGADFEAALKAGISTGLFEFGGNSFIVNANNDGTYSVLMNNGIQPYGVYTNYVFNLYKSGDTLSDEFRYISIISLSEGHFECDGKTYDIQDSDGDTVISESGNNVAMLSTFVVRRNTGEDTLDIEFKKEVEKVVTGMILSSKQTDDFTYDLPKMDSNGELVYNEDGSLEHEETKITVTNKNGQYIMNCIQTTYLIDSYANPTGEHPFGTDGDGYDVLSRMMYGGRISLLVGFVVVILEMVLGVIMGGIAGYFGGWIDTLIMRLVDIFNCIPSLPILIILGALFDQMKMPSYTRLVWMMAVLGFLGWSSVARLVRGQILSLREQEFMVATESCGISVSRRIFRHLIPNVMPQLIVTATAGLGSVIITESTLSFLGLGVKRPLATWGTMINAVTGSSEAMTQYTYIWIPVGLLICLTVIAFNFVGDGLRDAFDPKMKR